MKIVLENRSLWNVSLVFGLGVLIAGCAGWSDASVEPVAGTDAALEGAPDWVSSSCSSFWEAGAANVCGVGSATGSRNVSLMRTAAIGRARTGLARSLGAKVTWMLEDYASTPAGSAEFGPVAGHPSRIVDVSKQITDVSLTGVEPVSHWTSSDGTFHSLVGLDVEVFSDRVSRMDQLSDALRQAVVERAEQAFSGAVGP